ncbi:class II aldolase/adducin family protein [Streptomyces xanthochromogenes]|uniref:class II aldolase/adducin family protein n=1 Tax=Streptomyces xanthochromogenes TaxID=67384 RepID=UPI0038228C9A
MTEMPEPIPVDQLRFDLPPVHDDPAQERQHRKERLAGALRLFARFGYEEGVSGHVTARDPELADCYWVNPFGVPFAHVTAGELILVNGEGQVVQGGHHVNQAAFTVHAQVHRARPDAVAVVHTHSTYGRALAALGEFVEPYTQEACAFFEDHAPSPESSTEVRRSEACGKDRSGTWTRSWSAGSLSRSRGHPAYLTSSSVSWRGRWGLRPATDGNREGSATAGPSAFPGSVSLKMLAGRCNKLLAERHELLPDPHRLLVHLMHGPDGRYKRPSLLGCSNHLQVDHVEGALSL